MSKDIAVMEQDAAGGYCSKCYTPVYTYYKFCPMCGAKFVPAEAKKEEENE